MHLISHLEPPALLPLSPPRPPCPDPVLSLFLWAGASPSAAPVLTTGSFPAPRKNYDTSLPCLSVFIPTPWKGAANSASPRALAGVQRMRGHSLPSSPPAKYRPQGYGGRSNHKFPVFTQGDGARGWAAVMHFAQGENIAFVLPRLPGAGWAPSGAIRQLGLSLFALFICLASQRAAGGAGNRLGLPDAGKSWGLTILGCLGGFRIHLDPFCSLLPFPNLGVTRMHRNGEIFSISPWCNAATRSSPGAFYRFFFFCRPIFPILGVPSHPSITVHVPALSTLVWCPRPRCGFLHRKGHQAWGNGTRVLVPQVN